MRVALRYVERAVLRAESSVVPNSEAPAAGWRPRPPPMIISWSCFGGVVDGETGVDVEGTGREIMYSYPPRYINEYVRSSGHGKVDVGAGREAMICPRRGTMEDWKVGRREGMYAFVATRMEREVRVEWRVLIFHSGEVWVCEGCGVMDWTGVCVARTRPFSMQILRMEVVKRYAWIRPAAYSKNPLTSSSPLTSGLLFFPLTWIFFKFSSVAS